MCVLYEIPQYVLKVRAFDGAYEDYCTVEIKISNVNDNPPVFQPYEGNITITEEELVPGCITTVSVYKILFCEMKSINLTTIVMYILL